MFYDADITHFTLYVDGLAKDQNNNKPVDNLKSKANTTDNASPLSAGRGDTFSDIGSKLSSAKDIVGGGCRHLSCTSLSNHPS